jgi:hypothetical protein
LLSGAETGALSINFGPGWTTSISSPIHPSSDRGSFRAYI